MIDRFGSKVSVAWPEHHLVWVEAALTLDFKDRQQAYRDIAEMTGRSVSAVRDRAKHVKAQQGREAEHARRKVVMRLPAEWALTTMIKQPTMAQLMGGRA